MTNKFIHAGVSLTALGIMVTAFAPVVTIHADTNSAVVEKDDTTEQIDKLFKQLEPQDQKEFKAIVRGSNMSNTEQVSVLRDKLATYQDGSQPTTAGIKIGTVKAIAKYVAKYTGRSIASKPLKAFINYLTNYEGKAQSGIQNGLVKYLHMNKNVAYWLARTIVFIYL
ncbi:hypothetical protein [Weissella viridescens]|uniref:hypothetical protein n=1 Tax=Weissella viridescens TaxID=1629 RepID=UPI003AF2FC80